MSLQPEVKLDVRPKRKIVRRHGACGPCQRSKIKCDGKEPCSTCRASKRRQKECVYSGKAKRANNRRSDCHATRTSRDVHGSNISDPSDNPPDYTSQQSGPFTPNSTCEQVIQDASDGIALLRMCNPISLGQTVEEYTTLLPPKAAYAGVLERSQTCAEELRDHTISLPRSNTSSGSTRRSAIKQKRSEPGLSSTDVLNSWDSRYSLIENWVSDGFLSHVRQEIEQFRREIELHTAKKGRAGHLQADVHEKAQVILRRLFNLDCTIGLFLGHKSILPLWIWFRFNAPNPALFWMHQENSHIAKRIELLDTLQALARVDGLREIGVAEGTQKYVRTCIADWQEKSKSRPSSLLSAASDNLSEEAHEQNFFLNLFSMMLHCRTANIERYYTSERVRQEQLSNVTASDTNGTLRTKKNGAKSIECQIAMKHAESALQAFHKLCEIDRQATANSWFRLHGALTAASMIGIGMAQKMKVVHEASLGQSLSTTRKCFKELKELNPGCIVFNQAELLFDELFRSTGSLWPAPNLNTMVEIKGDASANEKISFATTDSYVPTVDVEESTNDLQMVSDEHFYAGPPYVYPLPHDNVLHPPMIYDREIYPRSEYMTEGEYQDYLRRTQDTGSIYPAQSMCHQAIVAQPQTTMSYTLPSEIISSTTDHTRFVNVTADDFERDPTTESHVIMEIQRRDLQQEQQSSFEANMSAPTSYYCDTTPRGAAESNTFGPGWQQQHYLQQGTSMGSIYETHSAHTGTYMQDSSMAYHESPSVSRHGLHPLTWPLHDDGQSQAQQLMI